MLRKALEEQRFHFLHAEGVGETCVLGGISSNVELVKQTCLREPPSSAKAAGIFVCLFVLDKCMGKVNEWLQTCLLVKGH